jgi:ankyrin repeat protein
MLIKHEEFDDVDFQEPTYSRTLLHEAIRYRRVNVCEYLLVRKQPNLELTDFQGYSALHQACESGTHEVIMLLLTQGADPHVLTKPIVHGTELTPLGVAIQKN